MDEKAVYDYLQSTWDKLEKQDGGYFPSKHDPEVFKQAAAHFNITIQKAHDIFDKIDKGIANTKAKRLISQYGSPMEAAAAVVKNNKEFPCK